MTSLSLFLLSTVVCFGTTAPFCPRHAVALVPRFRSSRQHGPLLARHPQQQWSPRTELDKKARHHKKERGPPPSELDRKILDLANNRRIQDAIQAMQNSFSEDSAAKLQLNTFHALLKACSLSRQQDAGFMANSVIACMESFSNAGRTDRKPHLGSYSMGINAWAKSRHPDSGKWAEMILDDMKGTITPDVVSYSNIMDACMGKTGESPSC
ncbi:unknown protein [Seminavis robusta]|uniref:Uncharacterized protein n=1 Tax=Seminavis robusta TaxID=568900 RepID=A0A9N8ENW9_9STRA|nr:unknown protein [Seminavis robusta]|eukprot:Sro1309_g261510.1 n/a (211) ;mRNA; f:7526-8158